MRDWRRITRSIADELGPDAARVRRMWLPQVAPAACAALLDELIAEKRIARSGPWLHLPTHSVSFSQAEQQLAERLLPLVEDGAFDPLWVRDLARKIAVGRAAGAAGAAAPDAARRHLSRW